ncbi:MAG: DUF115 domain-containing protein [Euryarchaeota archaeon]|nr:DUF115 domain-containing protein [Euryarchaeota archaeon]
MSKVHLKSLDWWWPIYRKIASSLGINPKKDEIATIEASKHLLSYGFDFFENVLRAENLLRGKTVAVVGAHESFLNQRIEGDVIIASDGAYNGLVLYKDILPEIVVTDFDGVSLKLLSRHKPLVFAHVHGDNILEYLRSAPNIINQLVPTTQAFPYFPFYNFGGFTDGDRAVAIAMALGARKVKVYGFKRDSIGKFSGKTRAPIKRKKLEIAYEIIEVLRNIHGTEVVIIED